MKRILLPILFFVLIFSSCSFFLQEEYGTVTIDLEDVKLRSINSSTGLPKISECELEINIKPEGQSSVYKKIESDEPKFFQATFPVGISLEINIRINGPSSSWSAHTKHTVKTGDNNIKLTLNKNAVSVAKLSFSVKDDDPNKYEFKIAGKTIDISSTEPPIFTRDSRGRLYIAYKEGRTWKLNRYESDGMENPFAPSSGILFAITSAESVTLASDPVKGTVYAASNSKLYLIKDDGSTVTTSAAGLSIPTGPFTVYDNKLFVLEPAPNPSDVNLKIYKIKDEYGSLIASQVGNPVSISKQQIKMETNYIQVDFKDILVKKDKIYLLFAKKNLISPIFYSLGGMLEYTYNSSEIIETPQKWGFNDTADFDSQSSIITAGEAHFYGPVRFIGYDEQNIYIADDGCTIQKNDNDYKIKNVNRIFSFNTSSKKLSSSSTENKWFEEHKSLVSPPPSPITGKVLLWEKNSNPNLGMVYYQVNYKNDEGNYDNLPEAFIEGSNSTGQIEYPTDIFCYDQEGHLYVVWNNTDNFYCVRRYEKKSDGSYDTVNVKEQALKGSGTTPLGSSKPPIAIAVDVSDNTNGYLYCSYIDESDNNKNYIIKNKWIKANGFNVVNGSPGILQVPVNETATAIAANEKGVFVAIKKEIQGPPKKYSIRIYRCKANFTFPNGYYVVVENNTNHNSGDSYSDKNITVMTILNDRLYYFISEQEGDVRPGTSQGQTVKVYGELWEVDGQLDDIHFNHNSENIWIRSQGYFPYRIIKPIPGELIIASDGYYGKKTPNEIENKNKVLSFGINSLNFKDTKAKFSRELSYPGQGGFEWK